VPLIDVIAMATTNPAAVVHRADKLGSLEVGREADITVLRVDEGPAKLSDGFETLISERRLSPVGCVRAGDWIAAA
jgi:dihydroorotase